MYLNCKTYFSLRYGTISTGRLVQLAAQNAVGALALTNINTTADLWDFVDFCQEQNIKPVAGAEIRNDNIFLYILLAKNNNGLFHINRFISIHLQQEKPFPTRPELPSDVYIIYPLLQFDAGELLAHEFIGVQTTEINKLYSCKTQLHPHKFVIRQPVTFEQENKQDKKWYNVHRLLRAIDRNIVLSKQNKQDIAGLHETFVPPTELLQAFKDYPFIITTTLQLLDSCCLEMDFKTDKTRKTYSTTKADDKKLQEQHYQKKTFRDEYLSLLQRFDVNYDDQYLFEFFS